MVIKKCRRDHQNRDLKNALIKKINTKIIKKCPEHKKSPDQKECLNQKRLNITFLTTTPSYLHSRSQIRLPLPLNQKEPTHHTN